MGNKRNKTTRAGVALLVVLIIVMTITVLSLGFLSRSDVELTCGKNMILKAQMDYLAESGLTHARGLIFHPGGVDTGGLEYWGGAVRQQLVPGDDYYDVSVVRDDANSTPQWIHYLITCSAYKEKDGTRFAQSNLSAVLKTIIQTHVPGIAVLNKAEVKNDGRIDSLTSIAMISTNSTSKNKIKVKDNGVIAGHVFAGPGGDPAEVIKIEGNGQITGIQSVLTEAVDIPALTEPSLGPSTGNFRRSSGTYTISSNLHCDSFTIRNSAIVEISGDVTILAKKDVLIENNAQLRILPDSTLTFYAKGKFKVINNAEVNANSADPSVLTINHMGKGKKSSRIDGYGLVYATVVSPASKLQVRDDAQFYGTFRGKDVSVEDRGQIHTVSGN